MADERSFTLVGNFKDNITPSLKKLNTQLAATTKSFEKMQKMVRPIAKDMAIMGDAASRMNQGMGGQRNAFETNLRAMKDYRSELGKISSAQRQMERKFRVPAAPFAPQSIPRGGGGGGGRPPSPAPVRSYAPDMGDGFTIEKGVLANLATNFVEGLFSQVTGAVGKAINYVKGALQERIDDEMGDIQSAGGILSIGKEKKVLWADTYQEAFAIQKKLNGEMANLAAALPGETGQYVANMKQVTDTVMKVTTSNGPAMIKAMQGYNSSVKTNQDAYVEATKQLAKFTTLASLGQEGGVPLTALAEQMLNADKINIKSLKTTYAGLQKNPLVSGALEKYEKEMNKAAAGSAERYAAMLKAFEQAFPVEVLDAMTNSADGIVQGLKSGLLNPDTGLLGLGRAIEVNFSGLNRKMGPAMEQLSVFDMFLQMFKAFGMVMSPIVSVLPKIIEPFKNLINPFKEFYVVAENTISNFKGETKRFAKMKLDFAEFRGSLSAIGKLAKAFGGDKAQIDKLDTMLTSGKLDFGAALQQAFKALFSSDALKKFGKAVGEALSGFLKMLSGLAASGSELADQSGLMAGFLEGWRANDGTGALMKIIKDIIGLVVKTIVMAGFEILTTDPISAAAVATLFIAPLRAKLLEFVGKFFSQTVTSLGSGLARGAAGIQGPMQSASAQQGMMMGARIKDSFSGTLAGRLGTGAQQFAQTQMPGVMGVGGRLGGVAARVGQFGGGLGAKMGGLGGGATVLTALTSAIDTFAKQADYANQVKDLNYQITSAQAIGDLATVSSLTKQRNMVIGEQKENLGAGIGGTVGAVAGGALGAAIAGPIGAMIGSQLGQMIGTTVGPAIGSWWNGTAWPAIQGLWNGVTELLRSQFDGFVNGIKGAFSQFGKDIQTIGNFLITAITNPLEAIKQLPQVLPAVLRTIFAPTVSILSGIWGSVKGVAGFLSNLKWPSWLGGGGNQPNKPAQNKPVGDGKGGLSKPKGGRAYDGNGSRRMPLGSAIASEMRNKPSGSHLVIANSSETVIPAAGGYGAEELMNTLKTGFSNSIVAYENISKGVNVNRQDMVQGFQKDAERSTQTNQKIDKYQTTTTNQISGITANVAALAAQVKQMGAMGMMGGIGGMGGGAGGGGAGGGGGMATGSGYGSKGSQIAGQLGTYIKQTGGAPGSIHEHPQHGGVKGRHSPNSYHYQGRAIDIGAYANEQGGVLSRIAQFNQKMGVKPVELLKAGDPGHSDHVHVAYAYGQGNPALFSSKEAAQKFEKSMVPSSVKVGSITGNSAEGFGGSTSVTNNITIQQQPGQNADELAMIVAQKIGEAVADARAASILV